MEETGVTLWSQIQPFAQATFGALLVWGGSWIADRRARSRVALDVIRQTEARKFELGRDHAKELLATARAIWDELSEHALVDAKHGDVTKHRMVSMQESAGLIPNVSLREVAEATYRLINNPESIEDDPRLLDFRLPAGPEGPPPPRVIQLLCISTLIEMTKAYLREEPPETQANPTSELALALAKGKGLSVQNLYPSDESKRWDGAYQPKPR